MSHQNLDLASILRHEGYRMTPQRQMVLDAVCDVQGHASPEEIYERVSIQSGAVNRATVYRVLKFLRKMGLVTATTSGDGRLLYEIAGADRHHHLVCRFCGQDVEVSDDLYAVFVDSIGERHGFQVETTHISLSGICRQCQEKT